MVVLKMTSSMVFFLDLPMDQFPRPKEFLQHRRVTGVLELSVQIIVDEIEEGLEIGVAGVFSELLTGIIEAG